MMRDKGRESMDVIPDEDEPAEAPVRYETKARGGYSDRAHEYEYTQKWHFPSRSRYKARR